MGSVGSFQSQIIPCSCLYLFSNYTVTLQMQSQLNWRILICCTCHFWGGSPVFSFLRLASPASKSLQWLISTPKWGGKNSHLSGLACLVVLWRGRDTENKHHWNMWRKLAVDGPHGGRHSPRLHALPRSKPHRLLGVLPGHSPRWAMRLLREAGLRLWHSWQIWTIQDPRKTWLA